MCQLRRRAQDAHVDQFGDLARLGEGDGLEPGFRRFHKELRGQARDMTALAFFRFHEDEMPFCLRGATFMNDVDGSLLLADELLSEFLGVGDGCRKQNELRGAAIKAADPLKTPENLRHVAPENPPVRVHFIDNHEPQLLPEGFPLGVVRQQSIMEHVRIGEQDVGMIGLESWSLIGSGIPVVDRGAEKGLVSLRGSASKKVLSASS